MMSVCFNHDLVQSLSNFSLQLKFKSEKCYREVDPEIASLNWHFTFQKKSVFVLETIVYTDF